MRTQNNSRFPPRLLYTIALSLLAILIALAVIAWLRSQRDNLAVPEAAILPIKPFTELVSPAPTPFALNEQLIIFKEQFETNQNGWEVSYGQQVAYAGSAIVLNDTPYSDYAWARPHLRFRDFIFTVDSLWLSGAVGGDYGVYFRLKDLQNYYKFTIRNDGWYSIAKIVEGEVDLHRG